MADCDTFSFFGHSIYIYIYILCGNKEFLLMSFKRIILENVKNSKEKYNIMVKS